VRRGLAWLRRHQHEDGRALTSYETAQTEAWRPPSSETTVALAALARGARLLPDEPSLREALDGFGHALLAWQHESGGIRNCLGESCTASLQNDPEVTDLVYTDGYALLALLDAFEATREQRYLGAARRLAAFLAAIQCGGDVLPLAGAWRGSYHLERRSWHGRADQSNPLDEGGMDSAYTGWTCGPILLGMVRLAEMAEPDH
jgi:hypothetical protein